MDGFYSVNSVEERIIKEEAKKKKKKKKSPPPWESLKGGEHRGCGDHAGHRLEKAELTTGLTFCPVHVVLPSKTLNSEEITLHPSSFIIQ